MHDQNKTKQRYQEGKKRNRWIFTWSVSEFHSQYARKTSNKQNQLQLCDVCSSLANFLIWTKTTYKSKHIEIRWYVYLVCAIRFELSRRAENAPVELQRKQGNFQSKNWNSTSQKYTRTTHSKNKLHEYLIRLIAEI